MVATQSKLLQRQQFSIRTHLITFTLHNEDSVTSCRVHGPPDKPIDWRLWMYRMHSYYRARQFVAEQRHFQSNVMAMIYDSLQFQTRLYTIDSFEMNAWRSLDYHWIFRMKKNVGSAALCSSTFKAAVSHWACDWKKPKLGLYAGNRGPVVGSLRPHEVNVTHSMFCAYYMTWPYNSKTTIDNFSLFNIVIQFGKAYISSWSWEVYLSVFVGADVVGALIASPYAPSLLD